MKRNDGEKEELDEGLREGRCDSGDWRIEGTEGRANGEEEPRKGAAKRVGEGVVGSLEGIEV